jgi:hypothetical protein
MKRSPLSAIFIAFAAVLSAADQKPAELMLFDGETLTGWAQTAFDTQKEVKIDPHFRDGRGAIVIPATEYLCGVNWKDESALPRTNYEISLEAMKVEGSDFFCGLTFPVGKSACTLIIGGWGGTVVGLSSVDGNDASENETSTGSDFKKDRWYRIRVRVTDERIEAWIDKEQFIDLETKNRHIGLRAGDIKLSLPLGIATFQTKAAIRDIVLKRL